MSLPASAIALVLAAAVIHAGWNRLLHDVEDRLPAFVISSAVAAVLLLPAVVAAPPVHALPLAALSGIAESAYAATLMAAYSRGALSVTYPIGRGTAPLLITLGGWVVLAQRPSPVVVAGAGVLGAGLLVVATAGRDTPPAAIAFALATGVCIAAYSLIDAHAVRDTNALGYLGVVMVVQGLVLLACTRRRAVDWRAAVGPGVLIGIGNVGAYALVLLAFQRAPAGPVATLRETSVLVGVLLARDRGGIRSWIGAAMVVAGAVLAAG